MKKRSYRSVSVKVVDTKQLCQELAWKRVVVGTDVAKEKFMAVLMTEDQQVGSTVRWNHPKETPLLIGLLVELKNSGAEIEVVMESTGSYGVAFQYALRKVGIPIYQMGAKRVHDAAEVYDGVPSKHDPKDAAIIAKLHLDGLSKPWPAPSDEQRELGAAVAIMRVFQEQASIQVSRLEGLLAMYWPELPRELELGSAAMSRLILKFGTPAEVSKREDEARKMMRRMCCPAEWEKKIERVIESAKTSLGVPPVAGELEALQTLVMDMNRAQRSYRQRRKVVQEMGQQNEAARNMSTVLGKTTAAVIVSEVGDPRDYSSASAYMKAAGLNLKERSSGEHKGQVKITKRGSGVARQYEYFTVLRLIFRDAVVKAWYLRKVERDGGVKMKAIVAIMRKLHRALWYVARGALFDSTKLFDVRRLGLVAS